MYHDKPPAPSRPLRSDRSHLPSASIDASRPQSITAKRIQHLSPLSPTTNHLPHPCSPSPSPPFYTPPQDPHPSRTNPPAHMVRPQLSAWIVISTSQPFITGAGISGNVSNREISSIGSSFWFIDSQRTTPVEPNVQEDLDFFLSLSLSCFKRTASTAISMLYYIYFFFPLRNEILKRFKQHNSQDLLTLLLNLLKNTTFTHKKIP